MPPETEQRNEATATEANPPSSAPALVLIGSGLTLLGGAMLSNQWLEARSLYASDRDGPLDIGLVVDAASSGMRTVSIAFLLSTMLFVLLGSVWRTGRAMALLLSLLAAGVISLWVFDQRTLLAGRAYTLAMFALALLAVGLAQTLGVRAKSSSRSGEFVDGRKHGRWYVYDSDGRCTALEDWDHGTLLVSKPQKR